MKECSINGCRSPVKARGWCNKHWTRWAKFGDPLAGGYDREEAKKFLHDVVLRYEGDECLIWPFGKTSSGYGRYTIGGKRVVVSREVCRIKNGEPPVGKYDAAHSCGNGHMGCVSPTHLSWKTRAQNHADKIGHDTHRRCMRSNLAKISEDTAREIKVRIARGYTRRQIVESLGVTRGTVDGIASGNSWAWL